ncbi:MAG: hypothetical protein AAGA48_07755 [Myxococcota bacterium]
MSRIHEALNEFNQESVTWKMLQAIYSTIPYSPTFDFWSSVDDATRELAPNATEEQLQLARQIGEGNKQVGNIIWMASLLDAGDKGYAVITGLATAFKLFSGKGVEALETDDQQRNDAVLKALGVSYMVYNAYPGTLAERAEAFRKSPTGQALSIYYGTVEVALPFADNVAFASGSALSNLLSSEGQAQFGRLTQMAGSGGQDLQGAAQMLAQLTEQFQRVATHTAGYVKPVAESIGPHLPNAMNAADKAAGVIANAADVMPVYRLLGGRLAAESAVLRALNPSTSA